MFQVKAFTLLELLVVMSIILVLSSMLFGMISAGNNAGEVNATRALVYTVSATIDQFTHETGSVPLPTGSASDPESGSWYPDENDGSWEKQQLWWRLSHEMTVAERTAMRDAGLAADLAANPFQSTDYMKEKHPSSGDRYAATKTIFDTIDNNEVEKLYRVKINTGWTYSNSSGDVHDNGTWLSHRGKYKEQILKIRGTIAKDLAERQYMTYACLDMSELGDERFLQDQTIVDSWGNPLIYIAHSTPAVEGWRYNSNYRIIESPKSGRVEVYDRDKDGVINEADWDMAPPSEEQVDHNGDGDIDIDDWGSLLWNARPGNSTGFYLGSAGPDGFFNCLYAHDDNDDNIFNQLEEK